MKAILALLLIVVAASALTVEQMDAGIAADSVHNINTPDRFRDQYAFELNQLGSEGNHEAVVESFIYKKEGSVYTFSERNLRIDLEGNKNTSGPYDFGYFMAAQELGFMFSADAADIDEKSYEHMWTTVDQICVGKHSSFSFMWVMPWRDGNGNGRFDMDDAADKVLYTEQVKFNMIDYTDMFFMEEELIPLVPCDPLGTSPDGCKMANMTARLYSTDHAGEAIMSCYYIPYVNINDTITYDNGDVMDFFSYRCQYTLRNLPVLPAEWSYGILANLLFDEMHEDQLNNLSSSSFQMGDFKLSYNDTALVNGSGVHVNATSFMGSLIYPFMAHFTANETYWQTRDVDEVNPDEDEFVPRMPPSPVPATADAYFFTFFTFGTTSQDSIVFTIMSEDEAVAQLPYPKIVPANASASSLLVGWSAVIVAIIMAMI
jgi:hypothetical protein